MKRVLIIFAKEPEIGKVKTRLRRFLSEDRILELYKAFLKDTVNTAEKVSCEEKVLAFDSTKRPAYLKRIAKRFKFYKQEGRALGQRMHNAFVYAQEKKAAKTVIVGSDSPTLPFKMIQQAFQKLDRYDVVLGPGTDGGYYLIGLKKPCLGLFRGVKWSSPTVLGDTLKRARKLSKSVASLYKWYDVDEPGSLKYLTRYLMRKRDRSIAPWTRKFFMNVKEVL